MSLSIVISVTHLLGVGHLARAAAIARALVADGHRVTLISGGVSAPLINTSSFNLVQLPPLKSAGTDFINLLDETGAKADAARFQARMDMSREALAKANPDVVITELFPFGRRALAGEFLDLIETARRQKPRPLMLASIRDILVPPSKQSRISETHRRLRTLYDGVLVHGDPDLTPLDVSWPQATDIADMLHYTGFIDDALPTDAYTEQFSHEAAASHEAAGDILVSGGGSAAGLFLYSAAIEAAQQDPAHRWRILVGAATPEADIKALLAKAPDNAIVERARPDFQTLLASCAVSVSQAGYNTMIDLVRARARAVVVPFERDRETEQRIRADYFAARGLVSIVPEVELTGTRLLAAVKEASKRQQPTASAFDRNGLMATTRLINTLTQAHCRKINVLAHKGVLAPCYKQASHDWSPVTTALARVKDAGRTVDIWWRDDDATTVTPALRQLLALAHSIEAPVAIAAVPAKTRADLIGHLLHDKLASLLVHGFSHENHAPAGDRKTEFPAARPLNIRMAEAKTALARLRALTGGTVLPVFVPPWNRMAADMPTALADIGFSGLSTFHDRGTATAAPGLVQINTHIDPMNWHAGGGLHDADSLIAQTAKAIETRLAVSADQQEPIGLLTHHLVQDAATWSFCASWLEQMLASNGVARLVPAATLFQASQTTTV
jgi:predicted glycosyltransferase